jgi:hypothetical protein
LSAWNIARSLIAWLRSAEWPQREAKSKARPPVAVGVEAHGPVDLEVVPLAVRIMSSSRSSRILAGRR